MVEKGIILLVIGAVVVGALIVIQQHGFDKESENGNGTVGDGQIAVCIDGLYFGVCTGDQHFDSGNSCFGLTTQQCFDKCNVLGTTCRIE
jgi:hypothetical protein